MTARKVRLGMIGGGADSFIGIAHRIAAYVGERYQLTGGVFSIDFKGSQSFAESLEVDLSRVYPDLDTFIDKELEKPDDQRIEVVSVLTPNFLHFPMARQLIEAGFNVICEKPMTLCVEEALELEKLVQERKVVFALAHTYTGYPMVRQMREMIGEGAIGNIQKIDVQYYQGWLNPVIHEPDKRANVWRLDPEKSGQSCCFGDIGVHAFNLVEYTTGLDVVRVLADLGTLYEDNALDVDGTALIETSNGVKGLVRASQIATGEENNLSIAVYGDKAALKWNQEDPNELLLLNCSQPRTIYKAGNTYNSTFAQESSKLAPGHPEGLLDALGNIYEGVAKAVRNQKFNKGSFPGVGDGVRGMKFIDAVLQSNRDGQVWTSL